MSDLLLCLSLLDRQKSEEDSGLSQGWFTAGQWSVAATSGSQPASYDCPVAALRLSFTTLHVLSLKSHR